ncbi:tRNA threonylcarbamoyladenosine biosynthesis protein TsaB [Pustulibacterium marinum]|uniref:tRNA threonylcarbamoyladenosine biosynthesis protein TsaB n=1 Tax=Pustulibacterium marinum TaxID=1224947 RepID=A0A1I7H9M2_9FLAO|nr:tRNA (adenosine(37)-N6)-threonylcarbamoyltransferase complex dimerization subunit type 1 TsaB [Pustulibacterium marinum]SFU57431.1 tRNA threonylcarbamoyladenosine biosynthesis protein TsaB [Pustulibacterium marinum]
MSKIICLETSGTNCSVAITENGKLIALKEENTGNFSHAEKLHVFIKAAMEEASVTQEDIDAVAVSKGPGSYTGLRIGVSAAKGLCFAWDKPLIAVSTLEVLAKQASLCKVDYIIPLLDARRMEVYSAILDKNLNFIREIKAEVIDENSFQEYIQKGKVVLLGDGMPKTKELISNVHIQYLEDRFPSAQELGMIASEKFEQKDFEDVAYFEPFYLKDFIAGKKN